MSAAAAVAATTVAATTVTATAVSCVAVSSAAVSSVTASSTKPDAEGEPIVDDGRLIDWRDDVVVRLGIDRLGARVALSVGVEIVSRGARRRYLRNSGHAGRCPKGQSDKAW
jgi:hypothetical protein